MKIQITALGRGGCTDFVAQPHRLHLGGQGAEARVQSVMDITLPLVGVFLAPKGTCTISPGFKSRPEVR